jgi:hypothetical protein
MKCLVTKLQRVARRRLECARDPIADVLPMGINVPLGSHSETPLEQWQEQIRRHRKKIEPQPETRESPLPPGHKPPDVLIDDYAAPPPR